MGKYKELIRNIPDYPKPGIIFRDITTLLKNGSAFKEVMTGISERYDSRGVDKVVGIEARGFILGGIIACNLEAGMIPVRKAGRLPCDTYTVTYELEYGEDTLELHKDAVSEEENVLIVDDLLATGGTARAVVELIEKAKANIVGIDFMIELTELKGREKLENFPVFSLIKY